jgi:hypothetical protein
LHQRCIWFWLRCNYCGKQWRLHTLKNGKGATAANTRVSIRSREQAVK